MRLFKLWLVYWRFYWNCDLITCSFHLFYLLCMLFCFGFFNLFCLINLTFLFLLRLSLGNVLWLSLFKNCTLNLIIFWGNLFYLCLFFLFNFFLLIIDLYNLFRFLISIINSLGFIISYFLLNVIYILF